MGVRDGAKVTTRLLLFTVVGVKCVASVEWTFVACSMICPLSDTRVKLITATACLALSNLYAF